MGSQFERLVATLDYPLYVVTTAAQNEPAGCLIGFATHCSIHPHHYDAQRAEASNVEQLFAIFDRSPHA